MNRRTWLLFILTVCSSLLLAQRDYRTHIRSMLHQTIFNTGEIGRALDANASTTVGLPTGTSSWEWPPNSYQILNQIIYWGHQNSFGNGILFGATINGAQVYKACGGLTDGSGNATPIAGIYCLPGIVSRTENYPVLADGSLNTAYNPDDAEETIVSKFVTTDPMKLAVTQTSRAWSYPGYDAFIIIEYDIVNNDTVDYTNGMVMFENAIVPSAFGMQRRYGLWNESANTTRSREVYARYDFSRYLAYVHSRDGFPDPVYFPKWSQEGDRGGLDSPQAVGFLVLHYDYANLQPRAQTTYILNDSARAWDSNGKFLQPYVSQQIPNRNVDMSRASTYGLTLANRAYSAFDFKATSATPKNDSIYWANYYSPTAAQNPVLNQQMMDYWQGRPKPRALSSGNWTQTTLLYTSFGPYVFAKGQHLKFAVAELVGYGAGVAADTVWRDAGGASTSTTQWYEPVPTWYDSLTYAGLSQLPGVQYMGNAYLKNGAHKLPWYVTGTMSKADTSPVISLRDVADRAIQMYTGDQLKKYDGVQFKPDITPSSGVYNTTYIPYPAPQLFVHDAADVKNKLVWGPQIEDFPNLPNVQAAKASGRIKAGLSYYIAMKSLTDFLGQWIRLDSIGVRDPRYFNVVAEYPNQYVIRDTTSKLGENYYYAVIAVDSLGGRSGMTNVTYHSTQQSAVVHLGGKVFVAPNPLILTSSFGGTTSSQGDIQDKVNFYGLPKHCRIRVFSYSGQLVGTVDHNSNTYSNEWFQISRNSQRIASGVYFYTVEDLDEGTRVNGKFVVIH